MPRSPSTLLRDTVKVEQEPAGTWPKSTFSNSAGGRLVMLRVLIVDDSRVYRDLLTEVLERQPNLADVVAAADIEAARLLLQARGFEVVLINMAMADGIAICRDLVATAPSARVVAVALSGNDEEAIACAEAGVAGYLLRSQSLGELIEAIASVAGGETSCPPRVAAALMRRLGSLAAERHSWRERGRLTPREREILVLIEEGLSNKEIARRLSIELRTVKNHVHNLLDKLNVHRRGEAAALLRRSGVANGPAPFA
jgi:DNA-binding NarL/FixJ family response regulator